MKQPVIFSGYARSGKTTTGDILQELGYKKVSTSDALHQVTRLFFLIFLGLDIDTYYKDKIALTVRSESKLLNIVQVAFWTNYREILKAIAEKILVPVFGREIFAIYALKRIKKHMANNELVFFETIGGDEFNVFSYYAGDMPMFKMNIRSPFEEPDADYRELIDGIEVHNDGTVEDLKQKLIEVLDAKSDV